MTDLMTHYSGSGTNDVRRYIVASLRMPAYGKYEFMVINDHPWKERGLPGSDPKLFMDRFMHWKVDCNAPHQVLPSSAQGNPLLLG